MTADVDQVEENKVQELLVLICQGKEVVHQLCRYLPDNEECDDYRNHDFRLRHLYGYAKDVRTEAAKLDELLMLETASRGGHRQERGFGNPVSNLEEVAHSLLRCWLLAEGILLELETVEPWCDDEWPNPPRFNSLELHSDCNNEVVELLENLYKKAAAALLGRTAE